MNKYNTGKRDANDAAIVEVIDHFHIKHIAGRPGDGYDYLLVINPVMFIEIKNPKAKPSDRRLTEIEQELKDYCHEQCIAYLVIEYPEQMADVLADHARIAERLEDITSDRSSEA